MKLRSWRSSLILRALHCNIDCPFGLLSAPFRPIPPVDETVCNLGGLRRSLTRRRNQEAHGFVPAIPCEEGWRDVRLRRSGSEAPIFSADHRSHHLANYHAWSSTVAGMVATECKPCSPTGQVRNPITCHFSGIHPAYDWRLHSKQCRTKFSS